MKALNYLKEHKILSAIIIVLFIILVGAIILFCLLSKTVGNDEYGNRLDEIENYEIGKSQISDIEDEIKALDNVESATYNLKGRLVNVIIKVDDSLSIDTAKEYAGKVLEHLDDDQKSYYDIQVFVTSNKEESETYPIIGYKNKASETLAWKK